MIASALADAVLAVLDVRMEGWTCPNEARTRLRSLPGITDVRLDAQRGKLHILYDGRRLTLRRAVREMDGSGIRLRPGFRNGE